jgi:lipopolysaccharide export system protein LptA
MKSSEMGKARFLLQAAVTLWLLAAPGAGTLALESDRTQPIQVEADSAEIDDGKGVSTYQGNVVIRQGSIRIEADRVTVQQKGSGSEKVTAVGSPVRFQQQPDKGELVKARAKRAEYAIDSELLYLLGDAVLIQGSDNFRSDRIIYDRGHAVVKAGAAAQGKQRVQMTIQPHAAAAKP